MLAFRRPVSLGMAPNLMNLWGFGAMDGPKPYKFIWFGAMDGPKPYEFMWFGAMEGPQPYEFMGFGAIPSYFLNPGESGQARKPGMIGSRCTWVPGFSQMSVPG